MRRNHISCLFPIVLSFDAIFVVFGAKIENLTSTLPTVSNGSAGGEWPGVLVFTQSAKDGDNILTRDQLLLHVEALKNLSSLSVDLFGVAWKLEDLCLKPSIPIPKGDGTGVDALSRALRVFATCIIITPIDCFWEGSIPHGPFPPDDTLAGFIPISWQTLDPQSALGLLASYSDLLSADYFNVSDIVKMFRMGGVTHGYQTLPCIDPLNKGCPKTSPNYVGVCDLVQRFLDWNDRFGEYQNFARIKASTTANPKTSSINDYDAFYDLANGNSSSSQKTGGDSSPNLFFGGSSKESPECTAYAQSIAKLVYDNSTLAALFLPNSTWHDYGFYLNWGCKGYATKFMQWPEELILGGRQPKVGKIEKVSALRTIIPLATDVGIYYRFLGVNEILKPNLTNWSLDAATAVRNAWRQKYSKAFSTWTNNGELVQKGALDRLTADKIIRVVETIRKFQANSPQPDSKSIPIIPK